MMWAEPHSVKICVSLILAFELIWDLKDKTSYCWAQTHRMAAMVGVLELHTKGQ